MQAGFLSQLPFARAPDNNMHKLKLQKMRLKIVISYDSVHPMKLMAADIYQLVRSTSGQLSGFHLEPGC